MTFVSIFFLCGQTYHTVIMTPYKKCHRLVRNSKKLSKQSLKSFLCLKVNFVILQ